MSRLLLSAPLLLTVDRIEPPVAVLEWPCGALIDTPLDVLPAELTEGDILRLRRGRSRIDFRSHPLGRRPAPPTENNSHAKKTHPHP